MNEGCDIDAQILTYTLLKFSDFLIRQSVRLGNDWDEVDFCVESAHELDVKLLETMGDISKTRIYRAR